MTDVHGTREPAALALVANLIGRYANHDEDCPKRVVVGRHYPQYETCSCGYQEDARAVFAALAVQNAARLAAPVEPPHKLMAQVLDALESDAPKAQRREAFEALRDWAYPIDAEPR